MIFKRQKNSPETSPSSEIPSAELSGHETCQATYDGIAMERVRLAVDLRTAMHPYVAEKKYFEEKWWSLRTTWQLDRFPSGDLDENQDESSLKLYQLTVDDATTTVWKREYPIEPEDETTNYWKSGFGGALSGYGVRLEDAHKENIQTTIDISLRPFDDIRDETIADIKKKAQDQVLRELIKECPDVPDEINDKEMAALNADILGFTNPLREFIRCRGDQSEKMWLLSEFLLSNGYNEMVAAYGDFKDDTVSEYGPETESIGRRLL